MQLIGILNITPDSFSDGGLYTTPEHILARCEQLIKEGTNIIDVGAESTRPGAIPLNALQEWERLSPSLSQIITLAHTHQRLVSLDTYHPENAKRAIDLGIDWINDVSGLTHPNMIALARSNPQSFVVMHHLGIPASSTHVLPEESSAVAIVCQWIKDTQQRLFDEGINPNQIIFDPGIGFGKTAKHSIELIQHMEILTALGEKILVGHSKKSFLRELYPHLSDSRVQETLEVSKLLVQKNVAFLRVHDIALHSALIS